MRVTCHELVRQEKMGEKSRIEEVNGVQVFSNNHVLMKKGLLLIMITLIIIMKECLYESINLSILKERLISDNDHNGKT